MLPLLWLRIHISTVVVDIDWLKQLRDGCWYICIIYYILSLWLVILIKRGIRTKKGKLPNQYLHGWWSSSLNSCCFLFNYWIYRMKYVSVPRVAIGNYISYYFLYCLYYVHHFEVPIVVDSIGYFVLFLCCSILILYSIYCWVISWFELEVIFLNVLHFVSCCCCFWFWFGILYCVCWNWLIEIAMR